MKRTWKKHNATLKAKVELAAVRGTGRLPSWRVSLGFIRTRSTTGRSSRWTGRRQDIVKALEDAGSDAGSLLLEPAGKVPDEPFGLVGVVGKEHRRRRYRCRAGKRRWPRIGWASGP